MSEKPLTLEQIEGIVSLKMSQMLMKNKPDQRNHAPSVVIAEAIYRALPSKGTDKSHADLVVRFMSGIYGFSHKQAELIADYITANYGSKGMVEKELCWECGKESCGCKTATKAPKEGSSAEWEKEFDEKFSKVWCDDPNSFIADGYCVREVKNWIKAKLSAATLVPLDTHKVCAFIDEFLSTQPTPQLKSELADAICSKFGSHPSRTVSVEEIQDVLMQWEDHTDNTRPRIILAKYIPNIANAIHALLIQPRKEGK